MNPKSEDKELAISPTWNVKDFLISMSILGGEEMELGKQIKKHRQEVQLSQEELADRVYVSRQTISNWENESLWKNLH